MKKAHDTTTNTQTTTETKIEKLAEDSRARTKTSIKRLNFTVKTVKAINALIDTLSDEDKTLFSYDTKNSEVQKYYFCFKIDINNKRFCLCYVHNNDIEFVFTQKFFNEHQIQSINTETAHTQTYSDKKTTNISFYNESKSENELIDLATRFLFEMLKLVIKDEKSENKQ